MRHRKDGRKLGKEASPRRLMLANIVKSLIEHESINTTLQKAKEARRLAERLVTFGKKGSIHHRRMAYRHLGDRALVKKLFDKIAPQFENIAGGYTRVIRNGFRRGDNAQMAVLQFCTPAGEQEDGKKKKKSVKLKDLKT